MNPEPPIAPPDEPDPQLGGVIRLLREERGLSQADLAARAQLAPATLSQLEDGTIDPPWATVTAIAQVLGVSVESIADAVVERRDESDEG